MRFFLPLLALSVVSLVVPAQAVRLTTGGSNATSLPRIDVLRSEEDRLVLDFELPELAIEDVSVGDRQFTLMTIPGGALDGAVGEPAVPVFTRLVLVPDGMNVSARVTSTDEDVMTSVTLMPMQREDGNALEFSSVVYARRGPGTEAMVSLGAPAVWRHIRVVPLTFRPVSFDPAGERVSVAGRVEVELTFERSSSSDARPKRSGPIARSFDRMYREVVVNYAETHNAREALPGTYLVICPNNSGVVSRLQPLLDWRQRKGMPTYLATTAETGTSTGSIKAFIQDAYDNWAIPPEYICLVGDADGSYAIPTWFENYSGYHGEGDHPYTQLDGNDPLSDVHLGRLSISSYDHLDLIVNKSVGYESTPYLSDDPDWFTRGCVVGDPGSSGYSTIFLSQWIKERLVQLGYTEVDTVFGGSFVTQMRTALNRGDTVFSYRGYLGMSGWSNSNTNQLTNGWKMPFAVVMTCGTGDFAGSTSRAEGFLRAGTAPSSPKGGIGSIGTATTGTHTRYNNCMMYGVFRGLLWDGASEMGPALNRGKLEMYLNYQQTSPSQVLIWSHWNSLMGDPAVDIFTGYPMAMTVDHPTVLAVGANSATISVDASGPVEDAQVCLWKGSETYAVGYTDANGELELPIDAATAGGMLLTVTKHDMHPYLTTIPVASQSIYVGYLDMVVDDDNSGTSSGNGDGVPNPGETIELQVQLKNFGTSTASSVIATLTSDDPYVAILDDVESFGSIGGGSSAWSTDDFDLEVSLDAPHGHTVRLGLDVESGANDWHSLIDLKLTSAALMTDATTLYGAGGNGILDPGETVELSVRLRNSGGATAQNTTGMLTSLSPFVSVLDASGDFGTIGVGGTGENTGDRFSISADPGAYRGHVANLQLITDFSGGATDTAVVLLTVGEASSTDPIGPDAYGYYAFDDTDTGYPEAPVYNWVEIDPGYGGDGTQVALGDNGTYQDKSRVVDLPFTFMYYGQEYDRATICSNGWVSMGTTYLVLYRNWTIPGAGGPPAMIAPFWDDLRESGGGHVYQKYDAANNHWIVQWSRMPNESGRVQNVQAILLDPAHHPTSTGDGEILFQYHTVDNYDPSDHHATAGIESPDQSDGVLYTYSRLYPAAAAPLAAGRAIRFLPAAIGPSGRLEGTVVNGSYGDDPLENADVTVLEIGRTFSTGPSGTYGGNVPEGLYTVTAEHAGFEPDTMNGVTVTEGQTTILNFSLIDIAGPMLTTTTHESTSDTLGPYPIPVEIEEYSGLAEATLFYRVNGGELETLVLNPQGGNNYLAEIPGQVYTSLVMYYVYARDEIGNEAFDPPNAPSEKFMFVVGPEVDIFVDDLEQDRGWSVGAGDDNATTGVWVWADPVGTEYNGYDVQPEDDHTPDPGTICYVTGNAGVGEAAGTNDVDGGKTTLFSPVFELSDFSTARVSYWVWYTNNRGNNPGTDYWNVGVTSNGSSWIALENTTESTNAWVERSFLLDDYIALTDQVQLRYVAQDDGSGSLVEAAIDDFVLTAMDDVVAVSSGVAVWATALDPCHPNPFNPSTMITYRVPDAVPVNLSLYNVSGRLVTTLVDGVVQKGEHQVRWDGRDASGRAASSGIYFMRLHAPGFMQVRQIALIR